MGYRATKREETTPANMASHVTLTLERRLAKKRFRVATRAEERVEVEWFSFWRKAENITASGTTPMRASWYTGSIAYLDSN